MSWILIIALVCFFPWSLILLAGLLIQRYVFKNTWKDAWDGTKEAFKEMWGLG